MFEKVSDNLLFPFQSYGRQTGLDPFSEVSFQTTVFDNAVEYSWFYFLFDLISCTQNALLLKATSQAAVHSVRDCLALMKVQHQREQTTRRVNL